MIELVVNKVGTSFGFQVEGARCPYLIKSVSPGIGGPAASVELQPGDQITHVNDETLENRTMFDVIKLIKASGGEVKLSVIKREERRSISMLKRPKILPPPPRRGSASLGVVNKPISPLMGRRPLPNPRSRSPSPVPGAHGSSENGNAKPGSSLRHMTTATEDTTAAEQPAKAMEQPEQEEPTAEPAQPTEPSVEPSSAIPDAASTPAADSEVNETSVQPDVDVDAEKATNGQQQLAGQDLVGDVGLFSKTGTRHAGLNQDDLMHERVVGVDGRIHHVAAVFDGHGLLGERASQSAVRKVKEMCKNNEIDFDAFLKDPSAAMSDLFEVLQEVVMAEHETPPETYTYPGPHDSTDFTLETDIAGLAQAYMNDRTGPRPIDFGCTAVVVVITGDSMVMGNAGDACAILCQACEEYEDEAMLVSRLHTASDQYEIERVHREFPDMAFFTPDGYLAPLDPVMGRYEVQLTRSLGHKLLREFGIVAKPYTRTFKLVPGRTQAIVLTSDGITDELSPHNIKGRLEQCDTAREAAQQLVEDAQEFCMDVDKIDDCTAAVLWFVGPQSQA